MKLGNDGSEAILRTVHLRLKFVCSLLNAYVYIHVYV